MENKAPWLKFYNGIRKNIDYPRLSMSGAVFNAVQKYPDHTALLYMGKKISYKKLGDNILRMQSVFEKSGVKKGDIVAVCLPNIPEAVYSLYALNRMGAVASFLHPLSAEAELQHYISELGARLVVTLDSLYKRFSVVCEKENAPDFLIVSAADSLPRYKKIAYAFSKESKKGRLQYSQKVRRLSILLKKAPLASIQEEKVSPEDTAVILFSGGTTGVPKGVMLSNLSFNAMALQTVEMSGCDVRFKSMLAAMPMFHGFGLGVCIHTVLISGAYSILVPRFTLKEYASLIRKHRPNFIAGVPTLYEALVDNEYLKNVKLDCLLGVFSGGDTLSVELKARFDTFLKEHGARTKIREGYGSTECVNVSCLTPVDVERVGSIGIPFPDMCYKICRVNSQEEAGIGEDGEICISGPTLMTGYLNSSEETDQVLKTHSDGRLWLHTGDIGMMDEDGFVYFKQRIKRIIVTSGYNVYPSQIERVLDSHPAVYQSCAVAVKDSYKMHRVKAYVVLHRGFAESDVLKEELFACCKKNIARYAMPKELEFINELPRTKVGKVDYVALEKNANRATDDD